MKIAVVGGGSIGLLISSMLVQLGFEDIILYTRTIQQRDEIIANGVNYKLNDKSLNYKIKCQVIDDCIDADICFLAVKYYHLENLLTNDKLSKVNTLVMLQNGYNHINLVKELSVENIVIGIVEHGALRTGMTNVEHTGIGMIKLGVLKGEASRMEDLIGNSTSSVFKFSFSNNWMELILDKLLANIVINPLTSIFRVNNGCLLSNPYFKQLSYWIFLEASHVLEIENLEEKWDYVESIIYKTSSNKSSMLKDVLNNQPTEIDSIVGPVIEIAKKKDIEIPYLNFIYNSIKGIEQRE
jgi:2-dehydropantoate 2-reductase